MLALILSTYSPLCLFDLSVLFIFLKEQILDLFINSVPHNSLVCCNRNSLHFQMILSHVHPPAHTPGMKCLGDSPDTSPFWKKMEGYELAKIFGDVGRC